MRGPDGCPWDRKQDHASLAGYLLEESHEALSAIHAGDSAAFKEELGDLLLQIVLHCQIAKEQGHFDFEDVSATINKKMIERHPHVFDENSKRNEHAGQALIKTAEQVVSQWHALKAKEAEAAGIKSIIYGVPNTMPALLQSLKISQKAAACGFEWHNEAQLWEQLESELMELKEAISAHTESEKTANSIAPDQELKNKALQQEIALELGDVLFTLVNVARWRDLNPEEALLLALDKFKKRFRMMEELSNHTLSDLSKEELEHLWLRAKDLEQQKMH